MNLKRKCNTVISNTIDLKNKSIWTIDGTLTDTITLSQSGPGTNGNEEVLDFPQISSVMIWSIPF